MEATMNNAEWQTAKAKVTVLHQQGAGYLKEAMAAGLLNGEAMKHAQMVVAENDRLRKEIAELKRERASMRGMIVDHRAERMNLYEREINRNGLRKDRKFIVFGGLGIAGISCSLTMTLMVVFSYIMMGR